MHAHVHVHTHTHTHTHTLTLTHSPTHTPTHPHTHLSCPVYRLPYNGHVTLIDEEAKSKHLTTSMYCQASNAAEPAAAAGALHSTTLFPHWLLSLSSTFVPCSVALPTEASPTHWALHLALWLDNMWLLLVTMFQPLAIGLMPACSGEGCHIPLLFWNPHSLQVPANQVSPSPLGPPCGRGWGSHPNSVCLGMRWSGIRAKCLSHSSLRFTTLKLVSTVSKSPHCSLVICEVMCCCHCCRLVMPRSVRMHR